MAEADGSPTSRRPYDNSRHRERAAATREGILAAASELLHESSVGDWTGLTVAAIAERAGVSERTVYRHFASERIAMAVQACATAQRCVELTIDWCHQRSTFGAPLATLVLRAAIASTTASIEKNLRMPFLFRVVVHIRFLLPATRGGGPAGSSGASSAYR